MNDNNSVTPPELHHYLKSIGDAWTLIIVSELIAGSCRFNELQRKVCGISPVTLTNRLKKMEHYGLLTRTARAEDQLSVNYCITDKGRALQPAIDAIRAYGAQHLSPRTPGDSSDCDIES
jgi:DNA-binding HxlR family transcriptional regulator